MGRTRTSRQDLPRRMYHYHGAYYLIGADRRRVNLGRDYGEAIRRYADLVQPVVTARTLGDVMTAYLLEKVPSKAPRTQSDYTEAISLLRPIFGAMRPDDLEPKDVYAYLRARQAKVRANREVAVLSNVMQLAIEMGLVNTNPCRQVRRNPESPADREVLDSEVEAFRPFCPAWMNVYLDIKLLTGLRQGDMLRLGKFAVRDDGLFCLTGKRNKRILFRWTPALRAGADAALALRRKPSEARMFVISARGFKSAWARAMHKFQPTDVSLRFAENDLRAKVATEAMDMGQDATSLLGHSSDAVTRRHYIRGTRKVNPLR